MFHLTKEGIPYGTIILGSRATWLDRHAAEELRSYVKKLSGATLIITHERYASSIEGGKIIIGRASTSDIVGAFAAHYPDVQLPDTGSLKKRLRLIAYIADDRMDLSTIAGIHRRQFTDQTFYRHAGTGKDISRISIRYFQSKTQRNFGDFSGL